MAYRRLSGLEATYVAQMMDEAGRFFAGIPIQRVYDDLLSSVTVRSDQAIQQLGFLFGTSFLSEDWLEWAMLEDSEYGDEISLKVRERDLGCAPLSMIRNRLEDGEQWDLIELRDRTIHRLRELAQHAV